MAAQSFRPESGSGAASACCQTPCQAVCQLAQGVEDQQGQAHQRGDLGHGEEVLHELAELEAPEVEPGEESDDRDGQELRRGDVEASGLEEDVLLGEPGQEHARVLGEGHRDSRDGAGLDDQEQRPAVEEARQRAVGLAQVDVLAARVGDHARQLAVAHGRGHGDERGDEPDDQQPARAAHGARDVGADDEDARADHGAGHQHGRVEESQLALESGSRGVAHGGHLIITAEDFINERTEAASSPENLAIRLFHLRRDGYGRCHSRVSQPFPSSRFTRNSLSDLSTNSPRGEFVDNSAAAPRRRRSCARGRISPEMTSRLA